MRILTSLLPPLDRPDLPMTDQAALVVLIWKVAVGIVAMVVTKLLLLSLLTKRAFLPNRHLWHLSVDSPSNLLKKNSRLSFQILLYSLFVYRIYFGFYRLKVFDFPDLTSVASEDFATSSSTPLRALLKH